ncbi:MAG: hypothetical protein ABTD50_02730 [Polyangiaceae bacterium]
MEPDDPNDMLTPKRTASGPSSHERIRPGARFPTSRPPAPAGEPPLGTVIRALGHCAHPPEGATAAEIAEADGSRTAIAWCGMCGAIRTPGDPEAEWIRPGLGMALESDDRLLALAAGIRTFMERLGDLTTSAHELCSRSDVDAGRAELHACVVSLDNAGAELARYAHAVLGELVE